MSDHNTFTEKTELENQMYALLLPILAKYESPGANSHQAAQRISAKVGEECRNWIARCQLMSGKDKE